MKKFHILTFWCQMNYADSARIKSVLLNLGFQYSDNIKKADIVIFDTCSVRQKAEDKITWLLKNIDKTKKIRITWCMVQHNIRYKKLTKKKTTDQFKIGNFIWITKNVKPEIIGLTTKDINEENYDPENSIFINNAFNPIFYNFKKSYKNLELIMRIDDIGYLSIILNKLGYKVNDKEKMYNEYEKIIPKNQNTSMNKHKKTAYVPISTWCNQFCSYCIVPYARGLERHFPVNQIIDEIKYHINNWSKEIVLLGQIVNKHPKFVEIIKQTLKIPWLKRLRYTSPYPTYYSKELLKLHENEEKLCPHIHIPLQSGSDKILKSMFRWYDSSQALKFIDDIKKLKRDISITTDIIIWFPNETDQDFQKTINLVKYGNFDMIYMGIYSNRPGTYADKNIKDNIDSKIKHQRREKLNNILNNISEENNNKEIWNIREVIINKKIKQWNQTIYEWYTDNMKQIIIESNKELEIWSFQKTKITKGFIFKLNWQIV